MGHTRGYAFQKSRDHGSRSCRPDESSCQILDRACNDGAGVLIPEPDEPDEGVAGLFVRHRETPDKVACHGVASVSHRVSLLPAPSDETIGAHLSESFPWTFVARAAKALPTTQALAAGRKKTWNLITWNLINGPWRPKDNWSFFLPFSFQ